MYLFFLEIGSIALSVAAIIFLILYIVEWRQRIKEEHEFRAQRTKDIQEYEYRLVEVEKAVELEKEWTEQFIRNHPNLGEQAKQILLDDLKAGKHRVKMPHEIVKESRK